MSTIKDYMEDSEDIKDKISSLRKDITKNEKSICRLLKPFINELVVSMQSDGQELLDISLDVREHIIVFILHYSESYTAFQDFAFNKQTNLFKAINNTNRSKCNLVFIARILEKLNTL
jgi:hypothetical protein